MQIDMHYYATYAIARMAGINTKIANQIANCAQYVDDANHLDSDENDDKSLFRGIATSHSLFKAGLTSWSLSDKNRQIWIPFHFLPGGKGNSFEEKVICQTDSEIAQQMMDNHVVLASQKAFGVHLLGIAAHVYMDTFSHYGFSGFCSHFNTVKSGSIETTHDNPETVLDVLENFYEEHIKPDLGEIGSKGLGHGAVATYPDKPWEIWHFEYDIPRLDAGTASGTRNNPETYYEGCQRLLEYFCRYANNSHNINANQEKIIKELLAFNGDKQQRCQNWLDAIGTGDLFKLDDGELDNIIYQGDAWTKQKDDFKGFENSADIAQTDVYKFFQAAIYHRWYILKDLLPEHGIIVL